MLAAAPFVVVTLLAALPHIGVVLYSFTAIAVEKAHGWGIDGQFGWYRTVIPSRYTLAGYRAVFNVPDIYQSIINSMKYSGIATGINIVPGNRHRLGAGAHQGDRPDRARRPGDAAPGRARAGDGLRVYRGGAAVGGDSSGGVVVWGHRATLVVVVCERGAVWGREGIAWGWGNVPRRESAGDTGDRVRGAAHALSGAVRAGGLQQTSVTLEEAAANLGAGPLRVLWKITLPLILANLIAGSLLTFAFSMLEVSDSLILAKYPQHFPITKMIYTLGNDTSGPENVRNACALGVLAMGLLAATMVSAALLMGKKLGAVFRA